MSLKLHNKFAAFVERWCAENASAAQRQWADDFMMGELEPAAERRPCTTTRVQLTDADTTPYYPHNKYTVRYAPTSRSHGPSPANTPMETD